MNRIIPILMMTALMLTAACGGKGGDSNGFPENFSSLTDEQKVTYMMQHVSSDSVARFIIYAALDKMPGIRIDSLNISTLKAY